MIPVIAVAVGRAMPWPAIAVGSVAGWTATALGAVLGREPAGGLFGLRLGMVAIGATLASCLDDRAWPVLDAVPVLVARRRAAVAWWVTAALLAWAAGAWSLAGLLGDAVLPTGWLLVELGGVGASALALASLRHADGAPLDGAVAGAVLVLAALALWWLPASLTLWPGWPGDAQWVPAHVRWTAIVVICACALSRGGSR